MCNERERPKCDPSRMTLSITLNRTAMTPQVQDKILANLSEALDMPVEDLKGRVTFKPAEPGV